MISSSDRLEAIKLITQAKVQGARTSKACQELGISTRTYQRWSKQGSETKDKRPERVYVKPKNKLSKTEKEKIIKICNKNEYADLPPNQIVPKLADQGIYIASESSFYRVLREYKQNAKRVATKNHVKKTPTTHVATAPNQVWSWDITWLPGIIKGHFFKLYLILDIFSRYIVHWEIHLIESQKHASALVKKAVFKHDVLNQPLVLHSDNGSPMKAKDFQNLLIDLGITRSYSRPRVSNDNPYSESLFRTLKYCKSFPWKGFSSIDEARAWVNEFVNIYNTESLHSSIKYVTPEQRHFGKDIEILAKRNEVYRLAKLRNPSRWSSDTRDWSRPHTVKLNPEKEDNVILESKMRQLT